MDQRSIERLKFDRRLERRRGWVDGKDVARELESLPDAADKVAAPEEVAAAPPEEGEAG